MNISISEYRDCIWKKLPILTTRFTNNTCNENQKYLKTSEQNEDKKKKMIYCTPIPISSKIIPECFCAVLEMNNDTNQIIGIGLIPNIAYHRKKNVYEDFNYNRYSYFAKKRIDRSEFSIEEEEVISILENLCFKGYGHLKRGQGITILPLLYLYKYYSSSDKSIDIVQIIRNMFNSRFILQK
jgi:hypothetical protein